MYVATDQKARLRCVAIANWADWLADNAQYRDGKVEIRKVWDQGRSLIPDWVDDCCSQAE